MCFTPMLQTLSTAWGAGSLEENYFQKWLTNTNHELERLEQDAAPAGWLCQWDRYSIPFAIYIITFLCKYRSQIRHICSMALYVSLIYRKSVYMCIHI